jgi:hypothetical protein
MQQRLDVQHVDLYRLAAEQVFQVNLANPREGCLTLRNHGEPGQDHRLHAGANTLAATRHCASTDTDRIAMIALSALSCSAH